MISTQRCKEAQFVKMIIPVVPQEEAGGDGARTREEQRGGGESARRGGDSFENAESSVGDLKHADSPDVSPLQNSRLREEVLDLSSRNLQLSNDNAELSGRLHDDQEAVRTLKERLATVSREQEEDRAAVSQHGVAVLHVVQRQCCWR